MTEVVVLYEGCMAGVAQNFIDEDGHVLIRARPRYEEIRLNYAAFRHRPVPHAAHYGVHAMPSLWRLP